MWPDWAIFCTLGNQSKLVATNILPKSPTIFVKLSKSLIFQVKLFLGNFYRYLAIFIWSHWIIPPHPPSFHCTAKKEKQHWPGNSDHYFAQPSKRSKNLIVPSKTFLNWPNFSLSGAPKKERKSFEYPSSFVVQVFIFYNIRPLKTVNGRGQHHYNFIAFSLLLEARKIRLVGR